MNGLAFGAGHATHDATALSPTFVVGAVGELLHRLTPGRHLLLVSVALSNSTEISDVHGFSALEEVMVEVAVRLRALTHGGRLLRVSPLGGVTAAIVVDACTVEDDLAALGDRIRDFVPVRGGEVWPVLTVAARECRREDDPAAALRDVRATLFEALDSSPGRTRWHHSATDRAAGDRMGVVLDLARALREDPDQLQLAYQPIVDLASGTTQAAEALLRWTHPVRGAVSPLEAVAAAERSGLIRELGLLVLHRALAQASVWNARPEQPGLVMHVNVSPLQLREPGFVDEVAQLLRRYGVPAADLLLEVTETDLMTNENSLLPILSDLRGLGVRIGIDDFGTGFSSIARLHQLPVDTVKVDRSLVAGIAESPTAFDLTRAVVGLLATRPVAVVMEGIETGVQAAHLRALGCRTGQGYLLGRPGPAAEFPLPRPAQPAPAVPVGPSGPLGPVATAAGPVCA